MLRAPSFAVRCVAAVVALASLAVKPVSGEDFVDLYIGAGCFWHVQKVVNMAEEVVLGRGAEDISGIAGYAGGKMNSGDVCYTDYFAKGHTEVVQVRQVPRSRLPDFVGYVWAALFPGGDRSDNINLGPEYRAALGILGGAASDIFAEIDAAQPIEANASLLPGVGDEGDTIGSRVIYVYDSTAFPFHQAELYHQFHDYRRSYITDLRGRGDLRETSCVNPYEEVVDLYVGAGCFWHVQKILNMAEEVVLGRGAANMSGIAGYAGGKMNSGEVCYTNYDKMGHTEVVQVRRVPRSRLPDFVRYVWSALFPGGYRSDNINLGPEYRAALGLPGGITSKFLPDIDAAQPANALATFLPGLGSEGDTITQNVIYVYDSMAFPFHQAELYHQFHDYRHKYTSQLESRGELRKLSCPSEVEAILSSPVIVTILTLSSILACCCLFAFVARRMGWTCSSFTCRARTEIAMEGKVSV